MSIKTKGGYTRRFRTEGQNDKLPLRHRELETEIGLLRLSDTNCLKTDNQRKNVGFKRKTKNPLILLIKIRKTDLHSRINHVLHFYYWNENGLKYSTGKIFYFIVCSYYYRDLRQ